MTVIDFSSRREVVMEPRVLSQEVSWKDAYFKNSYQFNIDDESALKVNYRISDDVLYDSWRNRRDYACCCAYTTKNLLGVFTVYITVKPPTILERIFCRKFFKKIRGNLIRTQEWRSF